MIERYFRVVSIVGKRVSINSSDSYVRKHVWLCDTCHVPSAVYGLHRGNTYLPNLRYLYYENDVWLLQLRK